MFLVVYNQYMKRLILISLLLASGGSIAEEDADLRTARILASSILVIDWWQTRYIAESPNYVEENKDLGFYPTKREVDLYFIGTLAGFYLLNQFGNKQWKWLVTGNYIVTGAEAITRNYNIGVRFDFSF